MGSDRADGVHFGRGRLSLWCLTAALSLTTLLAACGGGSSGSTLGGGTQATAPTISTQPLSQTVSAGATATFSVVANGSGTLSYQWSKNGTPIAGATSATYTTPATLAADNDASFTVLVSSSAGLVTSNAAILSVNAGSSQGVPPTLSAQPQSQTVSEGSPASFSVVATGTGPLSYQWQKNGIALVGATAAIYATPASIVADSGESFTVVVTNANGQVSSPAAVLTVLPLQAGNADPEGLYYGSLSLASQQAAVPFFAIILKDGTAVAFAVQSYVMPEVPIGIGFHGLKVVTTGNGFTSSFTAHTQSGFPNGLTATSGTMTGTIMPGASITGSVNVPGVDTGTFTLNLSPSSYAPSASIGVIVGTYQYGYAVGPSPGTVYQATETILTDGTGTGSDNASCTYSGTYATPDANHNAYSVVTNSSCGTPPQAQPVYSGIAAFFPANSSTGAELNTNLNSVNQGINTGVSNFATDTLVSIADNGTTTYMTFAHK